jgi:isoquinoline 1-oxidoreductase alpha subunit
MVVDAEADTPLLWALREDCALTGTKFGCGVSLCGACTVMLDGAPVRSCATPVSHAAQGEVTTIEGLRDASTNTERARIALAVQHAWTARSVTQCGYCQSGLIMAAVALLSRVAAPSDDEINSALRGHICRCGTYERARAAIHDASAALTAGRAAR